MEISGIYSHVIFSCSLGRQTRFLLSRQTDSNCPTDSSYSPVLSSVLIHSSSTALSFYVISTSMDQTNFTCFLQIKQVSFLKWSIWKEVAPSSLHTWFLTTRHFNPTKTLGGLIARWLLAGDDLGSLKAV